MTISYEKETDIDLGIDCEELARTVGDRVLDQENCPYESQISLILTDDEGIREVNREHRGLDRSTDVLSFPMVDFPSPAEYSVLEEDDSLFDLDTGELLLGDIMISAEHVTAQAEAYGHSIRREFCFLVAHSMLHLLGYDHMTPPEAAVMEAKQEQVLQSLGITR